MSSRLGEGSTFTVYLPASHEADEAGVIAPAQKTGAGPPGAGEAPPRSEEPLPDFAVPEGEAALTVLLERGHLDVISAESGQEAIALLQQTPDVSVVLTDIMMPVMSGYETIRAIRKLPQWADLPIVAITTSVTAGERERCIDAGASAYIPKPVDAADLLVVLDEWLPSVSHAEEPAEAGA